MKTFVASQNDDGMRLSRFVQKVCRTLPQSHMHKAFRNKRIKVNGKRQLPDYTLQCGDVLELYINDEYFTQKRGNTTRSAHEVSLPSHFKHVPKIYEDEGIALLFKPSGILAHRGDDGQHGILDAYIHELAEQGIYRPDDENTFAPALCNRIDRNTEGILIAAKTAGALREMNEAIRENLVHKSYLCVCTAAPPKGTHHAFLCREHATHSVRVSSEAFEGAKPISTTVHSVEQKREYFMCEVQLLTGRTHQIRAHLAHLGAPLLGDAKYGGRKAPTGFLGQMLCAFGIAFGERLPKNSCIHSLAGRSFTAKEHSRLLRWWQSL